ncbi:MAG TPA: serine protease, partial [Cyanobacteria bacterium UBA11153]|nr:serine protease [Cyanobacteria bacterium UBA11153]
IAKVMPNSPAAQSGLRAGDIIRKINGEAVQNAEDVQGFVENSQVGSQLQMEVRRDRRDIQVTVRPGAFPTQR